jgi:hypothetical protein
MLGLSTHRKPERVSRKIHQKLIPTGINYKDTGASYARIFIIYFSKHHYADQINGKNMGQVQGRGEITRAHGMKACGNTIWRLSGQVHDQVALNRKKGHMEI